MCPTEIGHMFAQSFVQHRHTSLTCLSRRISADPAAPVKESQDERRAFLAVQQQRQSRRVSLPCAEAEDEATAAARKPSVHVIVTADYSPNNLSNNDYDKLKKVLKHFKNILLHALKPT